MKTTSDKSWMVHPAMDRPSTSQNVILLKTNEILRNWYIPKDPKKTNNGIQSDIIDEILANTIAIGKKLRKVEQITFFK